MILKIESASNENEDEMLAYLKKHENTSLFLLGNYENYGGSIGTSPFSGQYKLIRSEGKIMGVFSLIKKGSLLVQSIVSEEVFEVVIESCKEEGIPITGLFGSWEVCSPLWKKLKEEKIIKEETFAQKEILYTIEPPIQDTTLPQIRLLSKEDLSQWLPMRMHYLDEEGFPSHLSEKELTDYFYEKVERKIVWGYFIHHTLVSIADLNAKAFDLGQVGGVFTLPDHRRKGYSKAIMQRLFHDCKTLHHIRKLIIFTGFENIAARTVYESSGCQKAEPFALFFGK
ncbi:MAG: GNAT family N-acetyltransferase [Chlamydiales bacterium]|nr:GNAT family N-acetyltransferase [Chlamydiales bacterium]